LLSKEKDVIDINTQESKNLFSPLMIASEKGHKNVVDYLISKNAEVNLVDRKNESALLKAIKGNHIEIVKVLLNARSNPLQKDIDGKSCIDFSTSPEMTKLLEVAIKDSQTDFSKEKEISVVPEKTLSPTKQPNENGTKFEDKTDLENSIKRLTEEKNSIELSKKKQ